MGLAADGHAKAVAQTSGTLAATITTALPNDILVAVVDFFSNGTNSAVSSIAGGGLTWTRRFQSGLLTPTTLAGTKMRKEVWWALASAVQAGITHTVTYTQDATTYSNLILFGVNGCNLSSPWDPNVSLPAASLVSSGSSSSTHNVTGISTSNADAMLLAMISAVANSGGVAADVAADSGWSLWEDNPNSGFYQVQGAEEKIVTALQSGLTVNMFNASGLFDYIAVVDALQKSGAPVTRSSAVMCG